MLAIVAAPPHVMIGRGVVNLVRFFKQKTAYEIMSGDWSSDVCSSDLIVIAAVAL